MASPLDSLGSSPDPYPVTERVARGRYLTPLLGARYVPRVSGKRTVDGDLIFRKNAASFGWIHGGRGRGAFHAGCGRGIMQFTRPPADSGPRRHGGSVRREDRAGSRSRAAP